MFFICFTVISFILKKVRYVPYLKKQKQSTVLCRMLEFVISLEIFVFISYFRIRMDGAEHLA